MTGEQAQDQLVFLLNRLNRDPFRGYAPGTLRVLRGTRADLNAEGCDLTICLGFG